MLNEISVTNTIIKELRYIFINNVTKIFTLNELILILYKHTQIIINYEKLNNLILNELYYNNYDVLFFKNLTSNKKINTFSLESIILIDD